MHFRSSLAAAAVFLSPVSLFSCSGERSDELGNECAVDDECADGELCRDGYCEGLDEIRLDGGDALVFAAASAQGAPVKVIVTSVNGRCADEACSVRTGASVTFEAPTAPGYRFVSWTGDSSCTGDEPVLELRNLKRDVACLAIYAKRQIVQGQVEQGLGSVRAESDAPFADCAENRCDVDRGAKVVLIAPELEGYRFAGWSGEGCEPPAGARLEIQVGAEDVLCTALYAPAFLVRGTVEGELAEVVASSESATAACTGESCYVDAGSDVTLSAPALEGYRFAGWTGEAAACLGEGRDLLVEAVDSDLTCTAQYVRRVSVHGSAAGATPTPSIRAVSSDNFAECAGSACEIDVGGAVTLFAPSVEGYRFTGWSGDCEGEARAAVELSEVQSDLACVAEYVLGVAVTGAAVGANAQVTAASSSPGASCSGGSCVIDVGGAVTLQAVTPTGYRFTGWTGDPECVSSQLTVSLTQVDSSKTCFANFARLRYTVGASAAPSQGGAVESTSESPTAVCNATGCVVDYGSSVLLRAVPRTGYTFTNWSGCSNSASASLTLSNITANRSCVANFALNRYQVAVAAAPTNAGSVSPCGANTCAVDHGGSVTLTAVANTGWTFSHWSGCASGNQPGLTLTGVVSDQMCTANFVRRRVTVSTTVAPASSGAVACSEPGCTVDYGGSVTLTASAATGYVFSSWSGCTASTSATLTRSDVTTHQTCTANFVRQRFTVRTSVSPTNAGTVRCSVSGCSVDYGGSITLTAEAASNYAFASWSCSQSSNRVLTLTNVTNNQSCQARFMVAKPDLIARITSTGTPRINANYQVVLPIQVLVENQGPVAAPTFKVALEYYAATNPGAYSWVSFSTSEQSPTSYVYLNGLSAFSSTTLNGFAIFGRSAIGATVTVRAEADSCSGEEFMPEYCRADEISESNNFSGAVTRTLPQLQ